MSSEIQSKKVWAEVERLWSKVFNAPEINCEEFVKRGSCLSACRYNGRIIDLCCIFCERKDFCPYCCTIVKAVQKKDKNLT